MNAYATYFDDAASLDSSSGGVLSLIASQFDVEYGVAMTKECYSAEFIRANEDISSLRGSKYIQADMGDTFNRVKKDLTQGKKVLFSGTGCQVNGLFGFLEKDYLNLILLEVVCHGVPSKKLWKKHIEYHETEKGKLASVNFRFKASEINNLKFKDNQLYIPKKENLFMGMFLNNSCLRPSCYECHAKYYKKLI